MKKKEAKKLTKDQSVREIEKLKKDLFNMRFKKINGQLQNVSEYSSIKKNIARLYNNLLGSKKWQKGFWKEK